jgi:hypothetical protein
MYVYVCGKRNVSVRVYEYVKTQVPMYTIRVCVPKKRRISPGVNVVVSTSASASASASASVRVSESESISESVSVSICVSHV